MPQSLDVRAILGTVFTSNVPAAPAVGATGCMLRDVRGAKSWQFRTEKSVK